MKNLTSYSKITQRESAVMGDDSFHNLLVSIHNGCYVEVQGTGRGGTVTGIIRDKWGVPIAVYVGRGGKEEDCICLNEVSFIEPYYPTCPVFVNDDQFYVEAFPYNKPAMKVW